MMQYKGRLKDGWPHPKKFLKNIMPGYDVPVANGEDIAGLVCGKCKLLLRDPLQLEDGKRICLSCLDREEIEHYRKRGTLARTEVFAADAQNDKGYFEDVFAKNTIANIKVHCRYKNNDCPWIGKLMDFENHIDVCDRKPEMCHQCGQEVQQKLLQLHLAKECPDRIATCEFCTMTLRQGSLENHVKMCPKKPVTCQHCSFVLQPEETKDHEQLWCPDTSTTCPFKEEGCQHDQVLNKNQLAVHIQETLIFHMLLLLSKIKVFGRTIKMMLENMSLMKDDLYTKLERLSRLFEDIESKVLSWTEFVREQMKRHWEELRFLKRTALESKDNLQEITISNGKHEAKLKDIESQTFVHESQISEQIAAYNEIRKQLQIMTDRVEALRGAQHDLRVGQQRLLGQGPKLDLPAPVYPAPGSPDYHVTYNGELIWKVKNVTQKRQDAILKKTASLMSPPFFSSPHGYQMCGRLYLNGDGAAKGKSISLFFAVMKGPFDALLNWPFNYTVTMMLLDQHRVKHHEETFKPDPTSSSFQKPKKDINIASGSPFFFSLDSLATHGYLVDDTLYIKIKVHVDQDCKG